MKKQAELISELKNLSSPLIIFGANITGEAICHICSRSGIPVAAFCDNNRMKCERPWCNHEVIHTSDLKSRFPTAAFLIAVIDIQDIIQQLESLGYLHYYSGSPLLQDFDPAQYPFDQEPGFVQYVLSSYQSSHNHFLDPDKIYLRSVDIVITERCSLKCRDCSNLMQYYQNPVHYSMDALTNEVDRLCSLVDEINEFRVIGGEPFMHREWPVITKQLIAEPKVKRVVIFTNGTILPEKQLLQGLQNSKVLFMITDYGKLSRNLAPLFDELTALHIPYHHVSTDSWTDCGKIAAHHRSPGEQEEVFRSCCVKNAYTLMRGKLYRCPFAANADVLEAIPDFPADSVNVMADLSQSDLKQQIRQLIHCKKFIAACDFCNGRRLDDPKIPAAIQTNAPLPYCRCR